MPVVDVQDPGLASEPLQRLDRRADEEREAPEAVVLPALYNRLAPCERAAVVQISLLGFAASADCDVTGRAAFRGSARYVRVEGMSAMLKIST